MEFDYKFVISALSLVIGILGFLYGRSDAKQKTAKEQLHKMITDAKTEVTIQSSIKEVSTKLDDICTRTSNIDRVIERMDDEAKHRLERLAVAESSLKSAHHRLDGHEQRLNALEREK